MAKVDNPDFSEHGHVWCTECPKADKHGIMLPAFWGVSMKGLLSCPTGCPTNLTEYAAAVALAEEMLAGAKVCPVCKTRPAVINGECEECAADH